MLLDLARWIFHRPPPSVTAYDRAMRTSDELIGKMREASDSNDPVRAILADIFQERHNIAYITTMYEANREMKSATQHVDDAARDSQS